MSRVFISGDVARWFLSLVVLVVFGGPVIAGEQAGDQRFTFRLQLSEVQPQIAIWLTDEQGVLVETVFVTGKVAKRGLGNRRGDLDGKMGGPRLSALPVWAHVCCVDYGDGNYYPSEDNPLPDAITSATPEAGEFVWEWKPADTLKWGGYFYYIEVNGSFDKNDHHDYSWYRGQPSIVWRGSIEVGDHTASSEAVIIGHGHVAGEDGVINPELSTLTTSLKLIEGAEAVYHP
jgi:hypothetical protein